MKMSTYQRVSFSPRMQRFALGTAAALGLGIAAAPASAAVIALYDFGTVATPTYASADTDANSTAVAFAPASGLGSTGNWNSTTNGIDTANGSPAPSFAQKPIAKTQAVAYSTDAYWSFSVSPNAGYELDLQSLTFRLGIANSSRPISYYLATNIGGFNNPVEAPVVARSTSGDINFDLSAPAFQNLAAPTEFRMYLYSDLGGSSGSRWSFDNVTLNAGVEVVPEPASATIAVLGMLWFGAARRRRH